MASGQDNSNTPGSGRFDACRLSLQGRIDRLPYLFLGITLFLIKFAVDWVVATQLLSRPWSLFNYLSGHQVTLLLSGSENDRMFLVTMFIIAVPFIAIGVILTVQRLRSARMPTWLALFFFLPTINILVFILLVAIPAEQHAQASARRRSHMRTSMLSRVIPNNPWLAAVVSISLTIAFGLLISGLSVYALGMYGFGLFVGAPFAMGLVGTIIYGFCPRRIKAVSCCVSLTSVLGLEVILLLIGAEGAGCLLMASPIWLFCGLLGGIVGECLQASQTGEREKALITILVVSAVPIFLGAEFVLQPPALLYQVRTHLDVGASAPVVWDHVVGFPDLPPPSEWIFEVGVAYPTRATIQGTGQGAIRRCEFSTGTFVEPINVWNPPHVLSFAVTENPPPMREWSIYGDVNAPHLNGFLISRAGQFELETLPNGETRLIGTTWYEHNMRPAAYWRAWSDRIIATIHRRVLSHIKNISEETAKQAR